MSTISKFSLKQLTLWFLLLTLIVTGCKDRQEIPPPENKYLVEVTPVAELSQAQITDIARSISPLLTGLVRYGVRIYKVSYKTPFVDGNEIIASGAVAVPLGDQTFPMLSVQHGTITSDSEAPSNLRPGSEFMEYGSVFAGLGYISVFPDYIGYGASNQFPHPYEHRESLGSACLDMLRATRELIAQEESVKWDNRLYISGFSEGGYATLALQKKLEETKEFNLKASTCGAGAYNKSQFMRYLVEGESHGISNYNRLYSWVLLSYNWIYGLDYPVNYFFREPYAAAIQTNLQQANLSGSFNTLLQDDFVRGLKEGTQADIIAALADNDLTNWKPVTPTQLYHGTDDQLVFYFNTETTYQSMRALGAINVELKRLEGKDHFTAVMDYLLGSYAFFSVNP